MQLAPLILILGQWQDRRDGLVLGKRKQVHHGAPTRVGPALRQAPDLHAINFAQCGEEQHRRVRRGDEQLSDDILILGRHGRAAFATALLRPEGIQRGPLDIAIHRDGNDHVFTFDQVFIVNAIGCGCNFCAARGGKFIAHGNQLFAHNGIELDAISQNGEQFFNAGGQTLELTANLITAKRGKTMQTQLQNSPDLRFAQAIAVASNFRLNSFNQANIAGNFSNWPIPD